MMTKEQVIEFIKKRNVSFISTVDEDGFPAMRAMLQPRKIEGNIIWFSTNTSSNKVKELIKQPKSCVYFYCKGPYFYTGVLLRGTATVLQDQASKNMLWLQGDTMFYKQGVTDPDYCVLRFVAQDARVYRNFKTETIQME